MLKVKKLGRFDKDYVRCSKRGKDMDKIMAIMLKLASEETLDPKYHDHPLKGNWAGKRECHIEPNWLLVYQISDESITFEATGSHSDLFG